MASQTETIQEVVETAAHHLSRIAGIIAAAAGDIVRELGELVNDVAQIPRGTQSAEPPVEE